MNPLLSIIIPTKNRYEYLRVILDIIRSIKNDEIEIVIQDNSNNDVFKNVFLNYINELKDNRIKYFYCDEKLSINENSDKAVLNSKGRYVSFIGDDDCVSTHIIEAVKWMEQETIDVLTFSCPYYIWSDVEYKYLSKKHTGVLGFKQPHSKVVFKDPMKELFRLLRNGGQNIRDMPQLYHGITTRKVLNKIYEVTGSFFPGSVPDMDVAVGLSLFAQKFCKIDVPMIIAGTAKKSAGGLGAAKLHKGDITKITALPKDTAKTWNPYIPFFWSGPTIYADSISKCLIRTGNKRMLEIFNYNYLYAKLFVFHGDFNAETRKTMKLNNKTSKLKVVYYTVLFFLQRSIDFASNRLPDIFKTNNNKIRFSTISEAVIFLDRLIDEMPLPWRKAH